MRAKVKDNCLTLKAESKEDKQFLKDAFDKVRLKKASLEPARTSFGLELDLELREREKE